MPQGKSKEDYLNELSSFEDYLKKNPLKKHKKIVTKGRDGRITVNNDFTLAYLKKGERRKVELKVTATPDTWKKIESFSLDNPDWFGVEFHSSFANPAVLEINEKTKPRGKQKKIYSFVNEIKIHSAILFAFFKYWCKQPVEEWPDYLEKLRARTKSDGYFQYIFETSQGGISEPYKLTRYCIEKVYEEGIQALNLQLFKDPFNFLETYIHADRRATRYGKLFSGKSSQEIARLGRTIRALDFIFSMLQVY